MIQNNHNQRFLFSNEIGNKKINKDEVTKMEKCCKKKKKEEKKEEKCCEEEKK